MSKRKPTKPPTTMTDDEALDFLFTKRGAQEIKKRSEGEPEKRVSPRKSKNDG